MPKREVLYKPNKAQSIKVGYPALVVNMSHPRCTMDGWIHTSKVLSYDKKLGIFETENSHYVPIHPKL
jgi:hypothetical protein